MTPAMFFYVTIVTLLLASGAAAIEWGTQGRVATRHLWTVAIVLGLIAPAGALWWRTVAPSTPPASTASIVQLRAAPGAVASNRASLQFGSAQPNMPQIIARLQASFVSLENANPRIVKMATLTWLLLSCVFAVWLLAGTLRWRHVRRKWHTTIVDGVKVDVSPFTGPAVLGFLSHRIVLPTWATLMSPEHRRLVLAHECEHIDARDPQRLALGIVALVLMPWNIGLWWCAARLRRAIELDCDARVLQRFPSAKDYGYVLLEVAARGRNTGPLAMPMVALLRLPSELELRIRAITRPHSAGARMIAVGSALAFAAIGAAFSAPVPYARVGASSVRPVRSDSLGLTELYMLTLRGDGRESAIVRSSAAGKERLRFIQVEERNKLDTLRRSRNDTLHAKARDERGFDMVLRALRQKNAALAHGELEIDWRRNAMMIEAALTRYYPGLVSVPEDGAVIWFVADSSGKVVHTRRDDSFMHHVMTADSVTARFPDVSASSIASVSIMRKQLGDKTFAVSWTTLKSTATH